MKNIMPYQLMVIFVMLGAGCGHADSNFERQLIGTWARADATFEMTLSPNGGFQSKYTGENKELTFAGGWSIKDGCVILVVTGKDSKNWAYLTNTPPVGNIETNRIISIGSERLMLEYKGDTNSFIRK